MTCRELADFLDDYISDQLPAELRKEFERHVAECRTCAAYLRSYRMTMTMGKAAYDDASDVVEEIPEGLVEAILNARRAGASSQARRES